MSPSASASREAPPTPEPKRPTPRSGRVERISPAAAEQANTAPVKPEDVVVSADVVTDMLKAYNFSYELVELDLAVVDRKQSQTNQARISKPIDEDQVAIYAVAMSKGNKFPPIVVYFGPNGKAIVMDGNHRVAAYDIADIEKAPAYVVRDPAPAQVQAFTYEANTKHGMPTPLPDRIRQAIYLINRGHTAKQAADQMGVKVETVRSAFDQWKADRRFDSLNVRKLSTLSQNARRRLDSIFSDVVLRAAAELVLDASIGGDQLSTFVRDVNALRSEREQLSFVAQERQRRSSLIKATAGGKMPLKQSLVTFQRSTSTVNGLNMDTLVRDLMEMPADVRMDHGKAAAESIERLMVVVRAVQQQGAQG